MSCPDLPRVALLCLAASAICLAPAVVHAGSIGYTDNRGVGAALGTATSGVTAKYYLKTTTAAQATIGVRGNSGISLGIDYVKDMRSITRNSWGRAFWGLGIGTGFWLYAPGDDTSAVGWLNLVGQVGWHFEDWPLEFMADWRPTIFAGGGDSLSMFGFLDATIALRWFF